MRGGWSNGRKAFILGLACVAALAGTWFSGLYIWFALTVGLTAWIWLIAGTQMWHFRHETGRSGRSGRSGPPRDRPAAMRPAATRPAGVRLPATGRRARQQDTPLGPEARIALAAEREASGVEEIFAALDRDLVGLAPVKQRSRRSPSVRNELERSRLRHAHRLATDLGRRCTRDDLMRIEPPDIGASQVFSAAGAADNDQ